MHTIRRGVLDAQAAHRERPFEVRHRVGLVHAGVEQHEAVARHDRPGVAVGNTWPGQRQAQTEHARQHTLAAPELASAALHPPPARETRLRLSSGVKEGAWPSEESASRRARRSQEAAASVQQATVPRKRISGRKGEAEAVARRYFDAIDARDIDAAVAMWAEGGREHVRGQVDIECPGGRARVHRRPHRRGPRPAHGGRLDDAEGDRCGVQWRLTRHLRGAGRLRRARPDRHADRSSRASTC